MGLFTGAGCVSRIFGPLAVGSIYTRYGTTWTFTVTCAMMIFPMIWLYKLRKRLYIEEVDIKIIEMKNLNGNGSIKTQNGSNSFIKVDKAVIINENGKSDEREKFLTNGNGVNH